MRGYGAPEICTGGRDGRVCVWDPRQNDLPVATFEPKVGTSDDDLDKKSSSTNVVRDCWSVGFGNSYNDEERCVVAGKFTDTSAQVSCEVIFAIILFCFNSNDGACNYYRL